MVDKGCVTGQAPKKHMYRSQDHEKIRQILIPIEICHINGQDTSAVFKYQGVLQKEQVADLTTFCRIRVPSCL
ncbi:ribosome maturation factor RimM [Sesbania bispinosa]|nr:ribosome maturation factor RimM [Sesbania bispinosa]